MKDVTKLDKTNQNTFLKTALTLNMVFTLSTISTIYVLIMAVLGQAIRNKFLNQEENFEIKEIFTSSRSNLQPLFEITNIILAFDVVLVFFHIIIIISSLTIASYCKKKLTKDGWLLICIMSPLFLLSNLSIHFTHIVIGLMKNTPLEWDCSISEQ